METKILLGFGLVIFELMLVLIAIVLPVEGIKLASIRITFENVFYTICLLAPVSVIIGYVSIADLGRADQYRFVDIQLQNSMKRMQTIKGYLIKYKEIHGHYPTNDEGLTVLVPGIMEECKEQLKWDHGRRHDLDNGLAIEGCNILAYSGDPFVYENRIGLPKSKFADSGVTIDKYRKYSMQVDKDIYLWSIGSKQADLIYKKWEPIKEKLYKALDSFIILLIAFPILTFKKCRASIESIAPIFLLFAGGIVLSAIFFPPFAVSCYEAALTMRRRPKITNEYLSLMDKYRDRGIISDKAYKKITDSMKEY